METRRLAPLRGQAEAAVEVPQPSGRGWIWLGVSVVLAGLGIGVLTGVLHVSGLPSRHSTLSLQASDSEGAVRVEWDRAAQPIVEAEKGSLLVVDGDNRREIALDSELLRRGSVQYRRQSADVEIRLRVHSPDGTPVQELTRLSGLAPLPPPTAPQLAAERFTPAPKPRTIRTKKRAAARASKPIPVYRYQRPKPAEVARKPEPNRVQARNPTPQLAEITPGHEPNDVLARNSALPPVRIAAPPDSVQAQNRSWLKRARIWPPPNPVRLFRKRRPPAEDR